MLASRSRSAVLPRERPRLAPPPLVLALTLGMAATLTLLYPRDDLVLRLASAPEGPLSAAYLRALLKTDPDNPRLRVLVATNLLRSGRFDEVQTTLQPALASPDPAVQREALWLSWLTENQRLPTTPAPLRHQRQERVRALGLTLVTLERDPSRLARIAGSLLAAGDKAVALEVFRRLELGAPGSLIRHLEDAAAIALASGDYAAAAEIHMVARQHASTPEARRAYFLAALRDLESGNRPADALALAERELGEFADDRQVLLELVRLARASGRPDLAERFVRRLLRMSLLEYGRRLLAGLDHIILRVRADAVAVPFDDAVYALAYTVFLENRKLEDAYRVAASAVRQAPDHLAWRRRLAQVAEWLKRPEEALDQWLFIARAQGENDAWEAVRRLSLGLLRDDAYEAYLRHRLAAAYDEALVLELAAAQERQGRPEAAAETLERFWQQRGGPRLAAARAELAERMGRLDHAVLWWQRATVGRPDASQAMRMATLYALLGKPDAARKALDDALTDEATPTAFWRLKAELAMRAGQPEQAIAALEAALSRPDAEAGDLAALEALLGEGQPLEAARVAALRWHRFGDTEALLRAIEGYQAHARFDQARTLLSALDEPTRRRLEANPRYCLLAARQAWQMGETAEAGRLYRQAERTAGKNPDVLESVLWFALERNDPAAIRRLLGRSQDMLRDHPDVLIAAYTTLGEVTRAWRLAAPRVGAHRGDPLWLMQAADLLEALDRHDEAWQLRRHALRQLGRAGQTPSSWLIARARLAAALTPGDAERAALRAAVAGHRDAAGELLLAHWIGQGNYSLARAWLYGRLARQASRPRWAELAVALAEDDRERLARLMDEPTGLPRRDAVEAASRLDGAVAASLAFAAQHDHPDDDALHGQLAPLLRAQGSRLALDGEGQRFAAMTENRLTTRLETALTPRLRLSLELGSTRRSLRDAALIGTTFDERAVLLRLDRAEHDGRWGIALGRRTALAATTPVSFHWQGQRGGLGLSFSAGRELPAEESLPLRMAGVKDELSLGLGWQPLYPFSLTLQGAASRYRAQTGTDLGRGWRAEIRASAALRREDPDLSLDLFAARLGFSPRVPGADAALQPLLPAGLAEFDPNFFLPRDFSLWGATLSSRTAYLDTPSQAWRPLWALTLSRHSLDGFGYDALLGAAGRVAGGDHGVLGLQWARAQGASPGTNRRLFFRYHLDL